MALPWFRFYTEFATDPKVCTLQEKDQIRLVKLFCLRCSETLHGLNDEEIAFALNISPDELAKSKDNLIRKGFITDDWAIRNWSKRQYKSDSSSERVRKFRAKEVEEGPETVTKRYSNAVDTETEEEKENKQTKPGPKLARLGKGLIENIINEYHNTLENLPTVRQPLGIVSSKNLRNRVKAFGGTDEKILAHFKALFTTVSKSDFLIGKKTDWSATFHWIIRPTNYEKILNGEYTPLKTYKKTKLTKLFCTELGPDYKPLHPVREIIKDSKGPIYISCVTCNCPMVEAYELEGFISDARKKDLPTQIKQVTEVTSGPTSISKLLQRKE